MLMLVLISISANGATLNCPDLNVVVSHSENRDDADTVCLASLQTVSFMTSHGFDTSTPISISIEETFVVHPSAQVIGQYDSRTMEVSVSSFARCCELAKKRPIFRLKKMSRELYKSFIVHEVAHAIAQSNFTIEHPSKVAQEYIAYTIQLATMEPALRNHILSAFDNAAFAADKEISELFLALAPETFAVKAYKHFQAPEHGTAFLRRLLTGDFPSRTR
jgi:hypothetical protein